jgi:predicted phage baseplate assembly protein
MSLPAPSLDDRRFQDIVDEAKRLIPRYCPEWTNHNLSDPGVALIELFAWMTDMFLYRLNQVPDRLYTKFLDLVGVELFPPQAAGTGLTFWLSAPEAEPVTVPVGTEVATAPEPGADPVVFVTVRDLHIAQPELVGLLTSSGPDRYEDAWEELRYPGGRVRCFTSDPPRPGDAFYIGFAHPLAGNVIRLDVETSVFGLGIDPERPPLAWEVWGGEAWIPAAVHRDATGGLNRTGSVTLLIPAWHDPLTLAHRRGFWLRGRYTEVEAGQPAYAASPEIQGLGAASLGGTVAAHQCQYVPAEVLGRSDGSPGQVFTCRQRPVLERQPKEVVVTEGADGHVEWREVPDFSRSDRRDHHFVWDGVTGQVRFGPAVAYPDGTVHQHGAVPAAGAEVSVTGYRTGGGAGGNVGAGTLTVLRTTIPYIDRVTNLERATGGVDGETVANAKLRGPLALRSGDRAVTAADVERLALDADAAVARARCLPPASPGGPVRLLVVPQVEKPPQTLELDDFAVDDRLFAQLRNYLEPRRMLGATIQIGTPYYQGVSVAVLVNATAGRAPDLVRERALEALYGWINPLVGGPGGSGWPFDTDLTAGALAEVLAAVDGIDRVEDVVLFEADVRNRTRVGQGRELVRLGPDSLFLSFRHWVVVR